MATGSSTSQRRQASSQPWGQIRPRTPGSGRSSMMISRACLVLALPDHLDVPLDIEPGRAGQPAGRLVRLLNGEGARNGLGVFFVDRLAVRQPLVVLAGQGYRADLHAVAAGGALGRVDETGLLC